MPRPHVINEPTTNYNLLMATSQYMTLRKMAHDRRVAPAALIREAINDYLAKHHTPETV